MDSSHFAPDRLPGFILGVVHHNCCWTRSTTDQIHHRPDPPQTRSTTDQSHLRPDPPQTRSTTDQIHHRPEPPQTRSTTDQIHHRPDPPQTRSTTDQMCSCDHVCCDGSWTLKLGNNHTTQSSACDWLPPDVPLWKTWRDAQGQRSRGLFFCGGWGRVTLRPLAAVQSASKQDETTEEEKPRTAAPVNTQWHNIQYKTHNSTQHNLQYTTHNITQQNTQHGTKTQLNTSKSHFHSCHFKLRCMCVCVCVCVSLPCVALGSTLHHNN